jgi:hypothetical protein
MRRDLPHSRRRRHSLRAGMARAASSPRQATAGRAAETGGDDMVKAWTARLRSIGGGPARRGRSSVAPRRARMLVRRRRPAATACLPRSDASRCLVGSLSRGGIEQSGSMGALRVGEITGQRIRGRATGWPMETRVRRRESRLLPPMTCIRCIAEARRRARGELAHATLHMPRFRGCRRPHRVRSGSRRAESVRSGAHRSPAISHGWAASSGRSRSARMPADASAECCSSPRPAGRLI